MDTPILSNYFLQTMHRVDPSDGVDAAISSASEYGRTDVVKLLLQDPRVDPSAEDSNAIRWGSDKGHFTVVKLLLADARVNPSARNNAALICASEYGHFVVVKLLLQDSRVDPSNLQVIMDLSFQHLKTDMQILSSCSFKILEFIHWIMINRSTRQFVRLPKMVTKILLECSSSLLPSSLSIDSTSQSDIFE